MLEPKFNHGKKVYIKKGFYRSYKGEIRSYEEVKTRNQKTDEEETIIQYVIKLDDIKEPQTIREDWLIPYKKFWVI